MSALNTGCFGLSDVVGYSLIAGLVVFLVVYFAFIKVIKGSAKPADNKKEA